jgi:predicted alpha/beta superfamily hydrolase
MITQLPAYFSVLGLLLPIALSACAKQDPASQQETYPPVVMPGTQVRTLKSTSNGRSYDIYIRLPGDREEHPDRTYPVLFVLDGQWDFKLLDSVHGGLLYDEFVPEMLIVGITYSGDSPDYDALRAQDMTPVPVEYVPGSGGAPQFLAFIKDELIPFIEANFPADPSRRILLGSSYGGLFTLYAMFENPELFSGYIAASPAVPYADWAVSQQEAAYAGKRQDLPVRLFISVGELERLAEPVDMFIEEINQRHYTGLVLETQVIEGERHAGNKPEAYNRGLRFIFQEA